MLVAGAIAMLLIPGAINIGSATGASKTLPHTNPTDGIEAKLFRALSGPIQQGNYKELAIAFFGLFFYSAG